jgi:hypothetical protein
MRVLPRLAQQGQPPGVVQPGGRALGLLHRWLDASRLAGPQAPGGALDEEPGAVAQGVTG